MSKSEHFNNMITYSVMFSFLTATFKIAAVSKPATTGSNMAGAMIPLLYICWFIGMLFFWYKIRENKEITAEE